MAIVGDECPVHKGNKITYINSCPTQGYICDNNSNLISQHIGLWESGGLGPSGEFIQPCNPQIKPTPVKVVNGKPAIFAPPPMNTSPAIGVPFQSPPAAYNPVWVTNPVYNGVFNINKPRPVSKPIDDYPHLCPRCNKSCYLGAGTSGVDHAVKSLNKICR